MRKLIEIAMLAEQIKKFPDHLFVSNCMSPKAFKESYKEEIKFLKNKLKTETNPQYLLIDINKLLIETKKDLEQLKKGKQITAFS